MFSNALLTGGSDASATSKFTRRRYDSVRDARQHGTEVEEKALIESMGYAKNMRNLREELKCEMDLLRNELKESIAGSLDSTKSIMKEVLSNIHELHAVQTGDALRMHFVSLREETLSGLEVVSKTLEEQLSSNVSHILTELATSRQRQEDTENALLEEMHKVQLGSTNVEALVSQSAAQITELLQEQQTSSSEAYADIRLITQDSSKYESAIVNCLDSQMSKYLKEHRVNVDFSTVIRHLDKHQWSTSNDIKTVHQEIAKIQQELNMDFALPENSFSPDMLFEKSTSYMAFRKSVSIQNAKEQGLPGAVEGAGSGSDIQTSGPDGVALRHCQTHPAILVARKSTRGSLSSRHGHRRHHDHHDSQPKRVRHYWSQTDGQGVEDAETQTDVMEKKSHKKQKPSPKRDMLSQFPSGQNTQFGAIVRSVGALKQNIADRKMTQPLVGDAEAMKKKARANLVKPQRTIFDDYWETGCLQAIGRSALFQNMTFLVILLNSVWIGVDLDNNDAAVLTDAHPVFFIAENIFCGYFTIELFIRFGCLKRKSACLADGWFMFDFFLLIVMVAETWVLVLVMFLLGMDQGSDLGPVHILRTVRLAKMARMARVVRLVRFLPELVVLLKGIKAGIRSVSIFMALWLMLLYVYAVIFKQATAEEDVGRIYFDTIPIAMNTLLLRGILPQFASIMDDVSDSQPWLWPVMLSFILLASLMMMNMLTGVLVEVVFVLSAVEKESTTVISIVANLRAAMAALEQDTSQKLSASDFKSLLVQPEIASIVNKSGADVLALLDQTEIIFENWQQEEGGSHMPFEKFIEVVLSMRATNAVTVKDMNQQLRLMQRCVKDTVSQCEDGILAALDTELTGMRSEMQKAFDHMQVAIAAVDRDSSSDDEGQSQSTGAPVEGAGSNADEEASD